MANEDSATLPVTVRLTAEERDALRAEAARRAIAGQATRINMSALVREALETWRRSNRK